MTTRVNEKTSEAKRKVKVKAIDQEEHDACNRAGWKESGESERERENVTLTHKLRAFSFSLVVCVCSIDVCARS